MEKEKLSAILSKGRNGTKGWFLYRAWPGTRSAIYVYLMPCSFLYLVYYLESYSW